MKKRLLTMLILFLTLVSCRNNEEDESFTSVATADKDLETISNVVLNYNSEESLSLDNFITNMLNVNSVNNEFVYNNRRFKVVDNKVETVLDDNTYSYSTISTVDELKRLDGLLDSFYYVSSLDTLFQIKDSNLGLDILLDNGLYARIVVTDKMVNAKAFGLAGDGITDDSIILQKIFNNISKYNIKALELPYGNYLCKNRLELSKVNDLKIVGNNSTFIVDDTFNDKSYFEFFFNIYGCNDVLFSKLSFNYKMTRSINGIKTQLGLHNSNNIEFYDIRYDIPDTTLSLSSKDREFTNMDLYTHWENVIINKCSFINTCDSNAGGSLWIRDFHGNGSKNCKVLNSYFYKIAHDELIAVFKGSIDNVLIKGNEFVVPDDKTSSSVMNFTLGTGSTHTNISFIENKVDTCATGGLIWCKGVNVIINDNDIKLHLSSKTTGNFRAFEAQKASDGIMNKISEFKNNKVVIDSYLDNYSFQVHVINNCEVVENNDIIVDLKATDVFLNVAKIDNNVVTVNKPCEFVCYNISNEVINNTFNVNAKVGTFFRYYGCSLKGDVLIKQNSFLYNYLEGDNDSSCLIMLNDSAMNGFRIDFIENNIKALKLSSKSRLLFYAPNDSNQTSYFIDNIVEGYNLKNNYLKNCKIIFEKVAL